MNPPSNLNYLREQRDLNSSKKHERDEIHGNGNPVKKPASNASRGFPSARASPRGRSSPRGRGMAGNGNHRGRGTAVQRPLILDNNLNNTHNILFPSPAHNSTAQHNIQIQKSNEDSFRRPSSGPNQVVRPQDLPRVAPHVAITKQQQPPKSATINPTSVIETIILSDSDEEEDEGELNKHVSTTSAVHLTQASQQELKRRMERYNNKLAVVTVSISSLTKERSNLMKKMQVCEDMLRNNGKAPMPDGDPIRASSSSHSLQHQLLQTQAGRLNSTPVTGSASSSVITATPPLNIQQEIAKTTVETTLPPSITSKQVPFNPFISGRSWKLQSCPDMQVLKSTKTSKMGKLSRKPRSLILYPSERFRQPESSLLDLAIIPTVNGDIQLFDLKKQSEMASIPKQTVFGAEGWAEEVSWVSSDTLAISLHPPSKPVDAAAPEQGLTLLRNCSVDRDGKLRYDITQFARTPHSKMIMAIEHLQTPSSSASDFQFVTGGADRTVQLWSIKDANSRKPYGQTAQPVYEQLHNTHTSEVTCLYHDKVASVLYSGGKDTRMVGFDLNSRQLMYGGKELRSEYMIKEILPISTEPKLLVVGGYQKINASSDFNIFDIRTQTHVLKITRGPSTGAYNRASIHQNGMLLTSGDVSNSIHIWDLRYIKVHCEYQRLQNVHSKSVISTRFYERGSIPSVLLSIGSDNELLFTDYERGR